MRAPDLRASRDCDVMWEWMASSVFTETIKNMDDRMVRNGLFTTKNG